MPVAGEGAKPPPPPSIAEPRMARRKALIQEHLRVIERAAAGREDNKQERDTLMELAASLRRRGEELDRVRAEDAEAWAAAHPPKKVPEERVAYLRDVAESVTDDDLDDDAELVAEQGVRRMPDELIDGVRKRLMESKKHAQGLMREYGANGYIEHFDADDFGLPPNYASLLCGMHVHLSQSS